MNIVYKITFPERINSGELPFYYIGSKCTASFDGNNILDKNGKIYTGSLKSCYTELYAECINSGKYTVEILAITEDDPRKLENKFQREVNAVSNTEYFNKTYASDKRLYDAPGYGVYKHVLTGKTIKLPVNHGFTDYVGVRSGSKNSIETRIKQSKSSAKYWNDEARKSQSIRSKQNMLNGTRDKIIKSWTNEKKLNHSITLKNTWTDEKRDRFSKMSVNRNNSSDYKTKFRKSKARGTWIYNEKLLKELWYKFNKPGYVTFRKIAVEHGFNDENYQGAVRSWSNYYLNRK